MGLTLSSVASFAELDAVAEEWDALVRAMPRPSPFLLHAWVSAWARHTDSSTEPAIQLAHRDGRLVGALPLCVTPSRGLKIAKLVGGPNAALGDLILAPGEGADTAAALVDRARGAGFDLLSTRGLPGGSRLAAAAGARLRVVKRVEAPYLDLSPGLEAVLTAKLSSKTRSSLRRKRRKLEEQGTVSNVVARTWQEIEPALEESFRLHRLRWEGRPDGSGLLTEPGRAFYRDAYRGLAQQGIARLITLSIDGKAIAFHSYLQLEGALYSDRLAFDPEYAKLSPGYINTMDMVEAAAGEGIRRVEFLGGTEEYKLSLADGFDPLYQGIGLASNVQGQLAAHAVVGTIHARRRLKQSERLHRLYFEQLAPARRALAAARSRVG